jgi:hypothetical protein
MTLDKRKRRYLRIALLCGFVGFGGCALRESARVHTLMQRAAALDRFSPHLGDAELTDEHQHALQLDIYALISLSFAAGLLFARNARERTAHS